MQNECIVFEISSITYAQKAKKILKNSNIKSELKRAVNGIDGCGYRLKVYGNENLVREILKNHNIKIRGSLEC